MGNLHSQILDELLPAALRRPLRFGDQAQIEALSDLERSIGKSLLGEFPHLPIQRVECFDPDLDDAIVIFVEAGDLAAAKHRVLSETGLLV